MAGIEWDQRELCPDGGCVGVIGDGGTCSVCGRAAPGGIPERPRAAPADDDVAPDVESIESDDREPADAPAWGERELCRDGACTGVIGDDGHCRVCGKEPG